MNKRSIVILILGILGVVLSYVDFIEWISINGFHIIDGWIEASKVTGFAAGFLDDLVLCTIMVLTLAIWDYKKLGPKWVAAIFIGTICFAVSLGLAFYLIRIGQNNYSKEV